MRKEILATLTAVAMSAPLLVSAADDSADRIAGSKAAIKEFMGELKGELQRAMKEGGPPHAIQVCNSVAPAIANKYSDKYGWDVGRTSLKYRNPNNAPDAWERTVLEAFESRKAEGDDPKTMAYGEVVDYKGGKAFRFMKAIPTAEICTKCHGTNIAAPIAAKLDELYPGDKARGFKPGDIRGAFTIIQPM